MNARAASSGRFLSLFKRKRLSQLPARFQRDGDDGAGFARVSEVRKQQSGSCGGARRKAANPSGASAPERAPPLICADNPDAARGCSAHTRTDAGSRSARPACVDFADELLRSTSDVALPQPDGQSGAQRDLEGRMLLSVVALRDDSENRAGLVAYQGRVHPASLVRS